MSTNTSRYNLVKPALTDTADITAMNGNWDTIDGMLGIAQTYSPIEITNGQDLNNLKGASIYKCPTNVTASSLANSPTTNAFSMVVLQSSGNSMTQIITEYMPTGAKQFRRNYYSGWDTPWGAWKEIPTKDDLAAISTKQDTITGAATTITSSNLTASRALVSNSSGKVAVSSVTSTELGYLSGVTSAIQTQLNAKQATITGGATTITTSNLTANRALVANGSGKVAVSTVTSTELGYMSGVTSNVQTQLNGKQATISGGASSIASSNLTASRTLVSDGSGKVAVSVVTATELGYLSGVTSNVQTQLNAKRNTSDVIDVAHGGTGKTTAADATNTLLSSLPVWSSAPTDSTYLVRQDTAGSASYGRVTFSTVANYVKSKLSNATQSAAGYMSAADKKKLDGISAGANAYTLPTASSSTLGGVKVGSNISLSSGTISLSKANVTSALGYTPPTADTNTWRGIQNNLTSTSTTDSLAAAQGKALKALIDGKAASSHTHDKLVYGTNAGEVAVTASGAVMQVRRDSNSVYSQIRCSTDGQSGAGTGYVYVSAGRFMPTSDNACYLGDSSHRWKNIYNAGSDRRLKKDIDYDMSKYLSIFDQFKPCHFRYKDDDTKENCGVIAQDAKALLSTIGVNDSGILFSDSDDPEALQFVDYNQFVGILIAKCQDLQKQVDELKKNEGK